MKKLIAAAAATLFATFAPAGAMAFEPGNTECIAPANAGGGWDFTCRQVGKALYDLKIVPNPVQVTNLAGGGGGVAFAEVVSKRNGDDNLIVAASSATTTRLAQGAFPGASKDQVRWLGTIGADYGVIAVAKDSPISTLPELFEAVKENPSAVSFAGGSAVGGWDHLKVLIAAKAAGFNDARAIKYVAFEGGGEAVTQLLGGHVQAFSGDISEAKGFVDSGDLKVLAVLAEERLPGEFDRFPTAKEQGIDAVGANWRGFYAPGGMSDEAYDFWVEAIKTVYESDTWKEVMAANGLMPLSRFGGDFEAFVDQQIADTEELSREIGLLQ
ncbi:Bug family tripartite tricarboxylate transporter substrate binding protein [Chelativorans intermedius]|uniref:Bug family tripartite tricarboxylate transporter substrate binding protein n=1 Tax=Chelativorans intermedius TaxID=515947 RepID=A0ABV6D6G1_9HYPH|nr:tripartite tricarboxylate transporter substrate-binding protein [Chelativorans intermedius]MCT8999439.1 tripartite tricarboxylate transporter substrate-binding protein [Chelativorans intermedius]